MGAGAHETFTNTSGWTGNKFQSYRTICIVCRRAVESAKANEQTGSQATARG